MASDTPLHGNLPPGCTEKEICDAAEPPECCEACGKVVNKCRCDYDEDREDRQRENLAEYRLTRGSDED